MYDSVFCPCPQCGELVEFQSKSGGCHLRRYSHRDVPADVAEGAWGDLNACEACGYAFELARPPTPRVRMEVKGEKEESEWD